MIYYNYINRLNNLNNLNNLNPLQEKIPMVVRPKRYLMVTEKG